LLVVTLRKNRYIITVVYYRYMGVVDMLALPCGFSVDSIVDAWVQDEIDSFAHYLVAFPDYLAWGTATREEEIERRAAELNSKRDAKTREYTKWHLSRCRQCSLAVHAELLAIAKKKRMQQFKFAVVSQAKELTIANGLSFSVQRCKCHQCEGDAIIDPYDYRQPRILCAPCRIGNRIELNRKTVERRKVKHDPRECAHCKTAFQPKRSTATFCSTRCRVASHRS
jgi:hypothetical protein